ncbi:hypothetical protein [Streptococcus suis]|uniref:Uncharacterized protein n=1 Tax=Streptococcus suis TaxID=1307 RepID=A0A9X4MXK7_STRSU|nr:hypothetical protein [Streptococcus suis]MBY5026022.1 hypothetical protein [Streptococcus suis]MDG4527485.1 hypothetical protein [Streptococcus suis]MDG4529799.1 hypothetical protein [Streptococcus suis]NQL51694.1 hypothetical protein [Streptococcus suis]QZT16376.1 hypothetical protein K6974_07100 [Streptococcus suis]
MKKLIAYILMFVACAWLVNYAVKLILEVWQVLALGIAAALVGWFAFRIIKHKDWR